MYIYNSIPHITNTLNLGKDLLEVLFEKRKSLPFRYDYALDIIDENKLNILIEREVIRRNGPYIEMDEHYLSFYELLLEANEEISTSVIDENIQLVYQLIDYYSKEDNDLRKLGYLRSELRTVPDNRHSSGYEGVRYDVVVGAQMAAVDLAGVDGSALVSPNWRIWTLNESRSTA